MTALDQYQRLEALGLWRAGRDVAPIEVIVTFGNARLTLMDGAEAPITQWSLAAVREMPDAGAHGMALSPDPEGDERLWLDDAPMIEAVRAVQLADDPAGAAARPGDARWLGRLAALLVLLAVAVGAWSLQGPARDALAAQVPEDVWRALSEDVVAQAERAGALRVCARTARVDPGLAAIAVRLGAAPAEGEPKLFTARDATAPVIALPDGRILLDAGAMRAADQPEALAGLMALGLARLDIDQPRTRVAEAAGLLGIAHLVARGRLPDGARMRVAEMLRAMPEREPRVDAGALRRLDAAGLPVAPLVLSLSGRGLPFDRLEALGAGDGVGAAPFTPALSDQDWLALRARCR